MLPPGFERRFNNANANGLEHIEEVVKENPFTPFDLSQYYTNYISYYLDEEKKKGLELFLNKLKLHSL